MGERIHSSETEGPHGSLSSPEKGPSRASPECFERCRRVGISGNAQGLLCLKLGWTTACDRSVSFLITTLVLRIGTD